jgi:hypothetical protein
LWSSAELRQRGFLEKSAIVEKIRDRRGGILPQQPCEVGEQFVDFVFLATAPGAVPGLIGSRLD